MLADSILGVDMSKQDNTLHERSLFSEPRSRSRGGLRSVARQRLSQMSSMRTLTSSQMSGSVSLQGRADLSRSPSTPFP